MTPIATHLNTDMVTVSVRYSLDLPLSPGISVPASTSSKRTRCKTSLTNQPTIQWLFPKTINRQFPMLQKKITSVVYLMYECMVNKALRSIDQALDSK